ncbi:MAG: hypothetical protein HZA29_03885 [Candidatus Omnitrophica bacterium]|nr:hypothetical protein [Candidatus Omnitrophota bacterium]
MPELRQDPVIGRWVIIAVERARRPGNFIDPVHRRHQDNPEDCFLCATAYEPVYTCGDVRVIRPQPLSDAAGQEFPVTRDGLYEVIKNTGVHETVIETPVHVANTADLEISQIRDLIRIYAARFDALACDTHLVHVLAYKNYGLSRFMHHACSHIMAMPVPSLEIMEKLSGARKYFEAHGHCVYCDLIRQELEAKKRVILETEHFLAVIPFAARFLFETWVLPKRHHCDFARGVEGREEDLAGMIKMVLRKFKQGFDDIAYNMVIQTAPFRRPQTDAGRWQTIEGDYHWHIEFIPRLTRMAGFEKGSGFYICAIPPEDMAEYLREVEI